MLPRKATAIPADYDFSPDVYVERVGSQLVLKKCPHCGSTHYHGLGHHFKDDPLPPSDKPFGHRTAHCANLPSVLEPRRHDLGYVLVLKADPYGKPRSTLREKPGRPL